VAASGDHIALTKRGKALTMIVGRDEYSQIKQLASERARQRLAEQLAEARRQVEAAGLDGGIVAEAIKSVRATG
jgi:PHD/YefM family antitoxin component YafN of YafNO toxin-antitoxin module